MDKYEIETITVQNHDSFTISAPYLASNIHIIFYHGGSYIAEGTNYHWKLIDTLLKELSCTVTYVDYPLAYNNSYLDTHNMVLKHYNILHEKYPNDRFILMGDSAGAGLALSLTLEVKNFNIQNIPEKTILFSPWLDISLDNPSIDVIEKFDFVLSKKSLVDAADHFAGYMDKHHYLLSPMYGNFKGINEIVVFTGTYDILHPDSLILDRVCEEQGIEINTYVYDKMPHDFILMPCSEANHALKKAISYINK